MNDTLRFLLSLSIGFAAIIGIVRFRKIDRSYYPFLYNIWAALLVEIICWLFNTHHHRKAFGITLTIYTLVDFCMFTWLFHNWGLFNRKKVIFGSILAAFSATWLTFVFMDGLARPNYYFIILYSFALIFFSVTTFNKVVVHERGSILRNAKFLICLGIMIFYTFFVVVYATELSGIRQNVSIELRKS